MQVILAKTAGFCFGVKRAVDKVYSQIETGKKIYTYGPIIHNEEVVKDLEQKGVSVIENDDELENIKEGVVVIRSHGVSKEVYDRIKGRGLEIVDATCPFVLKIHRTVEKESSLGKNIVIIGNAGHPEVEGIIGWCMDKGQDKPVVIGSLEEAEAYHPQKSDCEICIVSQTTFNSKKFKEILDIFHKKDYTVNAVNTICSATEERQTEARGIAKEVDAMIVIGGQHSSNSRKLYEICCEECENTYFIQTLDDLNLDLPKSIPCVGITAGASTPNNIIEEVRNNVRKF